MLTCIARSKQSSDGSTDQTGKIDPDAAPASKEAIQKLSYQIKDMALKASGSYRHCNPWTSQSNVRKIGSYGESESVSSDKFRWSYRRTWSSNSSTSTAGRKELEARLKGISSGEVTPASVSASASLRRVEPVVFVEENEPKEWVAQVEPGVLITFLSLPRGGNDLKRIRFSQEIFNKYQAQRWWAENYDKVMELYHVQRLNRQALPLSTPPRSEDESSKGESTGVSPVTPPLDKERLPHTLNRPVSTSSDSLDQQSMHSRYNYDSCGVTSTPNLSSGAKTEKSSLDTSMRTSTSRDADRSGELSISNASDPENEWVEEDEPGVYITIRALPDGRRELKRVRFSREKFGEVHARLWWDENRARIHKRYM